MMELLSTKIPDPSFEEACAQAQILLESIPFIKTEPIVSYELSKLISVAAMEPSHVIFTSVTAVEATCTYLQGLQPEWNVYCTAPATQKAVERLLPSAGILATGSNAEDLARQLTQTAVTRFQFFCGDQRRNELPDLLRAQKIAVEEVVVYRTVATPVIITKAYDGIVFFSPSAVTSFFSVNNIPAHTVLFCIGNTTAAAINNNIPNQVVISHDPAQESFMEDIRQHFRNIPEAEIKARKLK